MTNNSIKYNVILKYLHYRMFKSYNIYSFSYDYLIYVERSLVLDWLDRDNFVQRTQK